MADSNNPFCDPSIGTSAPKWDTLDYVIWKVWPQSFGGGMPKLTQYKNAWVVHNKTTIKQAGAAHSIPALLLATVAWAEVGGKPDGSKYPAFALRAFDWSGSDWIDKHLTLTKHPSTTSFGAVSIQLRAAASELGLNSNDLDFQAQTQLTQCLDNDIFNLNVVAKHLHSLIVYDYPTANTLALSQEQFIVAGSRYNRGTARALTDMTQSIKATTGSPERDYSSYGRAMLRHAPDIALLLGI